ncbi:MAG TPA: hypothetical protein VIH11_04195, partial [Gemmatimonadaceae bacterium]
MLEGVGTKGLLGFGPVAKVAGRILGRFVPVLGPVLLAGDLLKLLNIIGLWAFPAYSLICRADAGVIAAGIPAWVQGRGLKLLSQGANSGNPFGWSARAKRARILRSWKPSISNLIEVAQTTDQIYGVGVSFGGLVGLVMDSAFGVEQKLRGAPVEITVVPGGEKFTGAARTLIEKWRTPALTDGRAAANVLAHGPVFNGTQDDFDLDEHLYALLAQVAAWGLLAPVVADPRFVDILNDATDVSWPPPVSQHFGLLESLAAETETTIAHGRWPLPGNPATITGAEYLSSTHDAVASATWALLARERDDPRASLMGACVMRIIARSWLLIAGSDDPLGWDPTPEWLLLDALALGNRLVPADVPPEQAMDFLRLFAAELERTGRRHLVAEQLEA